MRSQPAEASVMEGERGASVVLRGMARVGVDAWPVPMHVGGGRGKEGNVRTYVPAVLHMHGCVPIFLLVVCAYAGALTYSSTHPHARRQDHIKRLHPPHEPTRHQRPALFLVQQMELLLQDSAQCSLRRPR